MRARGWRLPAPTCFTARRRLSTRSTPRSSRTYGTGYRESFRLAARLTLPSEPRQVHADLRHLDAERLVAGLVVRRVTAQQMQLGDVPLREAPSRGCCSGGSSSRC